MPISESDKLIFIHIPKTGGTSIEHALGMHGDNVDIGIRPYLNQKKNQQTLFGKGLQHLTAKAIHRRIGENKFSSYFKFSIVRNPYDRLVSYAAWLKEDKDIELSRSEFNEILDKSMSNLRYRYNFMLKPQYKFVYIKNKLITDQLFRFEQFEDGIKLLEKQLKRTIHIDLRMPSKHKNYAYYFNKKNITLVRSIYKKDFEYFGYDL